MLGHNRGGQLREARSITARRPAVLRGHRCAADKYAGRPDSGILRGRRGEDPIVDVLRPTRAIPIAELVSRQRVRMPSCWCHVTHNSTPKTRCLHRSKLFKPAPSPDQAANCERVAQLVRSHLTSPRKEGSADLGQENQARCQAGVNVPPSAVWVACVPSWWGLSMNWGSGRRAGGPR
jgi:hypothetical protein